MVNNWALSWDRISPALKHSDKTFKKKKKKERTQKCKSNQKNVTKNVNLGDKNSSHSVKKKQKFKFR